MAAAADRLDGDVLETLSPELVLIDAALCEKVRRRLDVPDDTLARIGRMRNESRSSAHSAAFGSEREPEIAEQAPAQPEFLPLAEAPLEVARHEVGIEDLIVTPPDELPSMPPKLLVLPEESAPRPPPAHTGSLVAEPEQLVAEHAEPPDGLIVVPTEDRARPESTRRSYPTLPSPPGDADDEDATDVVLRQIRGRFNQETQAPHREPPRRRRRRHRLLSLVSLFAALCSIAIYAVDVQLGASQLPLPIPS